jgi:hypothetical protein
MFKSKSLFKSNPFYTFNGEGPPDLEVIDYWFMFAILLPEWVIGYAPCKRDTPAIK